MDTENKNINIDLRTYFKKNIDSILKTLLELYEFQENIKFVNPRIVKKGE